LIKPRRWYDSSDVDIAVSGCSKNILSIMAEIEWATKKESDVVDLDIHPLAHLLKNKGEKVYG
jgi:hypothetical protein